MQLVLCRWQAESVQMVCSKQLYSYWSEMGTTTSLQRSTNFSCHYLDITILNLGQHRRTLLWKCIRHCKWKKSGHRATGKAASLRLGFIIIQFYASVTGQKIQSEASHLQWCQQSSSFQKTPKLCSKQIRQQKYCFLILRKNFWTSDKVKSCTKC